MPYLDFFALELKKTIVVFEISILQFVRLQNFVKKKKCINSRQKMSYSSIFGLEFEDNIFIFEISTLEVVYLQNFVKK